MIWIIVKPSLRFIEYSFCKSLVRIMMMQSKELFVLLAQRCAG